MSFQLPNTIVEAEVDGILRFFLTLIPQELVSLRGLPSDLVVGSYSNISNTKLEPHKNFKENIKFRDTLLNFINTVLAFQDDIISQAKVNDSGWIYLIDQRTPTPLGDVPSEDVIGGFEVLNGNILKFHENKKYALVSKEGPVNFGNNVNELFYQHMKKLISED